MAKLDSGGTASLVSDAIAGMGSRSHLARTSRDPLMADVRVAEDRYLDTTRDRVAGAGRAPTPPRSGSDFVAAHLYASLVRDSTRCHHPNPAMKPPRFLGIVLLTCWGWSFSAAPTAIAGIVRVEFVVRVLSPDRCSPQRDGSLAKDVAVPDSTISGQLEYDSGTAVSTPTDPAVPDYYYFVPGGLRVSLAIGKQAPLEHLSNGAAWISSALRGGGPGQRNLGFTADSKNDLKEWPGEIERLVFQLVLQSSDETLQLSDLPKSAELNSMPLSGLSRFSLSGEKLVSEDRMHPTLWIICGELTSVVASDEPPK
jgi:hypothetical protein